MRTGLRYGETMMGYWCNKDDQFKACAAATNALAPVVKECNKKQTQFESEFCAMAIVYPVTILAHLAKYFGRYIEWFGR